MRIIITGSRGLIGSEVTRYLKEKYEVIEYDTMLGFDLSNEKLVKDIFKVKADALVNLFAKNDHVSFGERKAGLYDVTLESVNDYLKTNVTSLFSVCREYARNNKKGCIVNFASTYALNAPMREKHIGYSTSKAAVVMLTKHLAVELAPDIRVNCIAPGGVLNNQPEEFIQYYSNEVPMKRMMSTGELNKIVEYLVTDDSSYVTGSVFSIDGGWTAW